MTNSVFVPGHITGFFTIENHEIKLKNGSCGVGFLLSKGVRTTVSSSDKLIIEVNQGDSTVIDEVLSIMEIDSTDFKITQDIQLPIGAGFGTSAASALSLTLALNEFLNLGYSDELCGQIAHMAEVNLGAGLGDVIAQTGKGLVLRTKPGAPGIGEIKSFNEDVFTISCCVPSISIINLEPLTATSIEATFALPNFEFALKTSNELTTPFPPIINLLALVIFAASFPRISIFLLILISPIVCVPVLPFVTIT